MSNVCEEHLFTRLYNELERSLWRFAFYKTGNKHQADDLVQNAFLKLWKNCHKVPQAKAKSFLYTVANNNFLNEIAHKKVVLKHAKLQPTKVDHEHPQFVLEEKQYLKKIQDALENLTEAQRTAFLLNRIEGKKYREIAKLLGISVKAVEKRISKALASLRKEIENI